MDIKECASGFPLSWFCSAHERDKAGRKDIEQNIQTMKRMSCYATRHLAQFVPHTVFGFISLSATRDPADPAAGGDFPDCSRLVEESKFEAATLTRKWNCQFMFLYRHVKRAVLGLWHRRRNASGDRRELGKTGKACATCFKPVWLVLRARNQHCATARKQIVHFKRVSHWLDRGPSYPSRCMR